MHAFVFLHIGQDVLCPKLMVRSIRHTMPKAQVIQVTDKESPGLPEVDAVERFPAFSGERLMLERLQGFSELGLNEAAYYIDTDLLWYRPPPAPNDVLEGDVRIAACTRSFDKQMLLEGKTHGQSFGEYFGQPLGEVFPILASVTSTRTSDVWKEVLDVLLALNEKYLVWYGDQEALKRYVRTTPYVPLPEEQYACLPEFIGEVPPPYAIHFKSKQRKPLMPQIAQQLGLDVN